MIFCLNASIDNANDVQFYCYPTGVFVLVPTVLILLRAGCFCVQIYKLYRPTSKRIANDMNHNREKCGTISDSFGHCINITSMDLLLNVLICAAHLMIWWIFILCIFYTPVMTCFGLVLCSSLPITTDYNTIPTFNQPSDGLVLHKENGKWTSIPNLCNAKWNWTFLLLLAFDHLLNSVRFSLTNGTPSMKKRWERMKRESLTAIYFT